MTERENYLRLAKIADSTNKDKDLVRAMRCIATMGVVLTDEERLLLQSAYQVALRIQFKNDTKLRSLYDSLVEALERHVIPAATSSESKACYYLILGDLHRDFSEICKSDIRIEVGEEAFVAYDTGAKIAKTDLRPTHATRLSIALNYSCLCSEFNGLGNRAISIAQTAIDDIENDKTITKEELEEADAIMTVIKVNLEQWKEELEDEDEDAEDVESGWESDGTTSEAQEVTENDILQ